MRKTQSMVKYTENLSNGDRMRQENCPEFRAPWSTDKQYY